MSDERIDIVINDKVDASISTNIDKIAASARTTDGAVKQLQQSLNMLSSGPIAKLNAALVKTDGALLKNALAQEKLSTQTAKTATQTARTAVQTANAAAAQDRAALAALRLQQAQERAATASKSLGSGLGSLVRGAAAAIGVGLSAHAILEAADAYTVLQNKLRNVTDSQAQLEEVTNRVFAIANLTRTSVDATAQAYSRFDLALKQQGASQEESLRLTQTINEMLKVSGATSTEAASGLLQLSQAFNKGKLDGDEFRTVMELMPAAADAIAKQLKVTRGELLKLAPEGKITIDVLRKGFAAVADEVDAKFAKTIPTIGDALTVFKNNGVKAFGELNKAVGFSDALSKSIIFLSEHMQALAIIALTVGSALLVAFAPALVTGISAVTAGVVSLTAAIAANPIGLLAVAIAAAISYIVVFKDEMIAANGEAAAWYNELSDLISFLKASLAPVIQFVSKLFGDLTGQTKELNATATGFSVTSSLLIEGLKLISIAAAEAVFAFKATGVVIGGVIAALGVLLRQGTVTEFQSVMTSIADDIAGAKDELDEFKKSVSEFGSKARIKTGVQLIQSAPTTASSSLRGAGAAPKPIVDPKEAKLAEKRALAISQINAELNKQLNAIGVLKPQRDVQEKMDQIEINLAGKKIKLHDDERKVILEKLKTIEDAKASQQAFDQIYEAAIAPARDYNAQLTAANKLLEIGAISQEHFNKTVTMASEAYKEAKDPLFKFNRDLEQQFDLLKAVGPAQDIAAQMQQLQNELLQKGVVLNTQQITAFRDKLETLQQEKLLNQELNKIYDETAGKQSALQLQIQATNKAYGIGLLSLDQYKQRLTDLAVAQANLKFQMGEGTFADSILSSLGQVTAGFENASVSMSKSMGDFFTTFTDGFADSVGKAIVYSDDLGDALRSVAQDAVAQLISSLVKLGIQYVINAAIGESVSAAALTASTAASVAAAGTTAVAWAPAAALASLASFGANSAPAMAGIAATTALSEGIAAASSVAGFEMGGYTGNGGTKDIAGVVHGQEFVVNAEATRKNRAALEAMNRGGSLSKTTSSSSSGGMINVNIENYGTSKEFEVQQLSESDVRIIARDEAKQTVRNETPNVVAASIANPNSKVSKSLNRSTQTQRRRG